jgi:hypothetical protein
MAKQIVDGWIQQWDVWVMKVRYTVVQKRAESNRPHCTYLVEVEP